VQNLQPKAAGVVPASGSLDVDDVRAVYRLIHELCELGNEPVEWNTHLIGALERAFDGSGGSAYAIRPDADPAKMAFVFSLHHVPGETWKRHIELGDVSDQPHTPAMMARLGTDFTATRQELVDDETWYASPFYRNVALPSEWDQMICSQMMLRSMGLIHGVGVVRAPGKPAFGERERAFLRFVHAELAYLWGKPEAVEVDSLPKRLLETISGMRRGLGRKELAQEMGVSPHTVHSHEKQLFQRFAVSGRGELLAKLARVIRPSLPK
jgi:DNA-binding XRE family transcriptional regulator